MLDTLSHIGGVVLAGRSTAVRSVHSLDAPRWQEADRENLRSLCETDAPRARFKNKTLLAELPIGGVHAGAIITMIDELQQRIDARARLLLEAAERAQMRLSGDRRVSESSASELLGFEPDTLAKLRQYGRGPVFHRLAVNGSRYSYSLTDLATWIESKRGFGGDEPA
jgi:hypothetical protein